MLPLLRSGSNMRLCADSDDMKSSSMATASMAVKALPDVSEATSPKGRHLSRSSAWKIHSSLRLAVLLTGLQFSFVIYATCLLYWLNPIPDFSTSTSMFDDDSSHNPLSAVTQGVVPRKGLQEVPQEPKSAVCEAENIPFDQMKSNKTQLIEKKTSLFRSVAIKTSFA